jgi:hypothetical protein
MFVDPIVDEVRNARELLAARFNYDLRAIFDDAKKRQAEGGRKVVRLPPRPVVRITRSLPSGEAETHETASSERIAR